MNWGQNFTDFEYIFIFFLIGNKIGYVKSGEQPGFIVDNECVIIRTN
jgi:hypothetical protein